VAELFVNGARGRLNVGISAGALSLTLRSGQGALFPTFGAGDFASQLTLLGSFNARAALVYPVRWNTIDDADVHDLQNATDIEDMYAAAVSAVRAALDSGTALKDQVRAATTRAALDAVVDGR